MAREKQQDDATPDGPSQEDVEKALDEKAGVELGDVEHSEGGITTKHDATDVGVPMLPGDPKEPVGPEDALGPGPKRGDYTGRVGPDGYNPTKTERIEDAEPGEPHTRVVDQRELAADIGDEPAKKGGVQTR